MYRPLPLLVFAAFVLAACPRPRQKGPGPCKQCEEERLDVQASLLQVERRAEGREEPAPVVPIVNFDEHLFKVEHAAKYVAAARAVGIAKTVLVASPKYTIFGKGHDTKAGYDENFGEIAKAVERWPDHFIAFSSIYPGDPGKLEMLKRHHAAGAKGLKLYSGQPGFWEPERGLMPKGMDEVLSYCESNGLPVLWHVRLSRYGEELEDKVLKRFPKLKVVLPHWGDVYRQKRGKPTGDLSRLLDTYPGLYLDTSLGARKAMTDGLAKISRHREAFKALIESHPGQFVVGMDVLVTGNAEKSARWIGMVLQAHRDQLEKEEFRTEFASRWSRYRPRQGALDADGLLRGLGLSPEILRKLYWETPAKLLGLGPPPQQPTP